MTCMLAASDLQSLAIAVLVIAIPCIVVAVAVGVMWLLKRWLGSATTMGSFDGDAGAAVRALGEAQGARARTAAVRFCVAAVMDVADDTMLVHDDRHWWGATYQSWLRQRLRIVEGAE